MRLPFLFLALLVFQLFGQEVHELQSECLNEARLMSKLLTEREYSKHKIPKKGGITVSVEFWIQEISSISEMTNDFEMEIYINEMWTDPNLKFSHLGACKANLTLYEQTLNKLWKPNTCFVNSKFAEIYESPFQNVFLTLFDNGTVWVNYRLRVKGPCEMELTNFPMDTQACRLNYQSFSYNNEEVRLQWNSQRKPVFAIQPDYPAGKWDELIVTFVFERRYMWYFLQAYLPTFFSIFISWIAFSLGPQAITPRTMIGVNALLSMIFHFGSIMKNLPKVSYIKAIDVWMLGSMLFVFLSLVELAVVGYTLQRRRGKEHIVEIIDQFARYLFPAGFSLFNRDYTFSSLCLLQQ
ncbi:Protein CBR-LGC-48 [Caenorhabditis briggsae]|uniref:Protein CBR-LGC-48 n=1 Tax=Caenorhabditis briggsae TaxID=6238 RepID=A8X2Z2_CAEBR|nr:Protein CBR-LGC-48 [Caenorhabditis briggsae]CAP27002.2 Protein CBR-LGC-48 [Caenorhabditis briggsae]